tara:strand:- start:18297 stop:18704 length:408 start_codon:yes stop_codon:yes gene_type:complete
MREMDLTPQNIDKLMGEVEASLGDFANLVALDAFTSLVYKTPVGNPDLWTTQAPDGYVGGQARASWNIQHGRPDTSLPTTWSAALPVAPQLKSMGLEPVYVTSSVPYMTRLENGWSSQGSYMQKRTVSELQMKYQ